MPLAIRRSYCDIADVRSRVCAPGQLPDYDTMIRMAAEIVVVSDEMNELFQASGARLPYGGNEWRDARHISVMGAAARMTGSAAAEAEYRELLQAMCVRLGGALPAQDAHEAKEALPATETGERPAVAVEVAVVPRAQRRRQATHQEGSAA
jgi:hypothetical protein